MIKFTASIALALTVAVSTFAADSSKSISLLLRARGLEGNEKLEVFSKKYPGDKAKKAPDDLKCEMYLENAYGNFATPESAKIVKQVGNDTDSYILVILTDKGAAAAELHYHFEENSNKLRFFNVSNLISELGASFIVFPDQTYVLRTDKCKFIVDIQNPLNITVLKPSK
ncbi:MAG: hypothetical protein EOP04_29365, partial [Proteobacteria bacterium]